MKEDRVFFTGGGVVIEGLYAAGESTGGVVVTHPHSMMGGSMMNNVVDALVTTFYRNGFSTLRFNFRGVGRSEGTFDNGIGEQEDVKGALNFLAEQGKNDVILAGYSFGAWVNSMLFPDLDYLADVIMISPPIDFVDFDFSGIRGKCGLIICGDRDQFCPLNKLRTVIEEIQCRLEIVQGADHFYFGRESGISGYLSDYLAAKV